MVKIADQKVQPEAAGAKRLSRSDWLNAAIRELEEHGVDGVKVVVLAKKLGATSGSFYWHFKSQPDLLTAVLDYWQVEQTDRIIDRASGFEGSPHDRILNLMLEVIEHDAASLDHAISVWARRVSQVREVFERTVRKRFDFAAWMFRQAGFDKRQAEIRGRLMVAYLMGESATMLKSNTRWRKVVQDEFDVLVA